MEQKLPYYMAYPTPLLYDDERKDRMDFEYMKSLYPEIHEGSMMFDEYPDQLQLLLMGRRVYDSAEKERVIDGLTRTEGNGADESWIRDLIQVMLYQEIYKRRSDQRKYNQKYYQGIVFPKG